MSITVKQVSPEQLAQARGCKAGNVCWRVCTELAAADLHGGPKRQVTEYELEWINAQTWT